MKAKSTPPSARPIRVSDLAHREAKRLVEVASLKGWSALGIDRTDPPSMMSILEEALLLLGKQSRKS